MTTTARWEVGNRLISWVLLGERGVKNSQILMTSLLDGPVPRTNGSADKWGWNFFANRYNWLEKRFCQPYWRIPWTLVWVAGQLKYKCVWKLENLIRFFSNNQWGQIVLHNAQNFYALWPSVESTSHTPTDCCWPDFPRKVQNGRVKFIYINDVRRVACSCAWSRYLCCAVVIW